MKQWLEKVKSCKKEQILILLLFGILLLVIAIPSGDGSAVSDTLEEAQENQAMSLSKTGELELRLEQILSQVEGIGKARVMLTLKSDGKKIVEKDMEQSQGKEESQNEGDALVSSQESSNESTVYEKDTRGNEVPYVTEELEPEIAGVLVIAQGAGSPAVVSEITEAVMALFGVEAHKIKVMKME